MLHKFSKFLSFFKAFLGEPALANLIINDNSVFKKKFLEKYPQINALPQIKMQDLGAAPEVSADTFFLDGSSMITDIRLLQTLAARNDIKNYLEIGTWRGESVHNVAKIIPDCTTINLPAEEMKRMGLEKKYVEQHAVLSRKNPSIKHIGANTKTFDFSGLSQNYDLIFIDGDHSYDMVLNDTQKVFRHLVHEKTIVVWHDYAFNPQNIRYEVLAAILDGVPKDFHPFIYHPKNTICAVFCRETLPTTEFDKMAFPENIFEVHITERPF